MFSKFNLFIRSSVLTILFLATCVGLCAQAPIPGHAGKIVNGTASLNNPNSVFVVGSYAYVASTGSSALEIIDISNASSSAHVGSLADGTGGAMLSSPVSVFVSGTNAYVASAGSNALEIVDVTDKSNPVHLASLTDGTGGAKLNSPSSVFVLGTTAYVVSSVGNSLEIIDVTDPSTPAHLGSIVDGAGGALLFSPVSVFVSGANAYVASAGSNALEIIDVTDPANPFHNGSLADGGAALLNAPSSVVVSGGNAFVASSGSNAIEIVDVTDPTAPAHKSSLVNGGSAILGNPLSVYLQGNYLYVASEGGNALEIVDVTDPASPQHFVSLSNGAGGAALASPTSVFVSGSSAFVTSSSANALEVITLFTPLAPTANAATGISENGFTANWTAVSNATSFEVEVSSDNFATLLTGYDPATTSAISLVVSGLTGCTDYQFRVRGVNADGTSTDSNVISVTTGVTTPTAAIASSFSQTGFTANWGSVSCATGYHLDVATDIAFSSILVAYNNLSVVGTSQSITGLTDGTTYYYRVRSSNGSGTSSNSNIISALTIPATPTANPASSITQSSFTANWNLVTGASGYHLDVATDNAFTSILPSYNDSSVSTGPQNIYYGITAGTTYYYRIRSNNASGTSSSSTPITVLTISADPVATAATSITQTSFTANWNSVSGASGYRLDVATNNTFSSILPSYSNLLVTGTSQSVTVPNPGTTYFYRVRSENASGTSSSSAPITVLTISADPVAAAATSIAQTSFTANWISVSGASGYRLDVSADNFATTLPSYTNLSVTGTSISVTGLTAGTTYYYRVRSSNTTGTSFDSNTISEITISLAPTTNSATSITQTSFTANWSSSAGASDYLLDVATDNTFTSILSAYHNLSVTGTSQSVVGLNPATTYFYRVRSNNAGGVSPYSFTTSALTVTADPVAIAASPVTQTSFTAKWNSVTGVSNYYLDVATTNSFGTSNLSAYNNISVATTSQVVLGLNAGTTYYYQVRSSNASGTSSSSNVISVITVPGDPIATAATSITQSSFTANWSAVTGASSFNIDVATDAAFSSILPAYNNFAVSGTLLNVNGLNGGTNYFYRLRAKNSSGTSSNSNAISLITDQATATQNIPTLLSGGKLENYSMFSIPLVEQSNDSTISTLFVSQGEYKPDKWRLLRWNSAAKNWDEYQNGLSTIDRGKSYWFNSVSSTNIPVTGKPFAKASFSLQLNSGWNQVGSPYDFDVSWTDVLFQNSLVSGVLLVETKLYKYASGSFVATDNLKAWSGGYVFNGGSPITLKIPFSVAHASGRISAKQFNQFTNAGDWFLPLKLTVNDIENNYGGIGMHSEANSSYDKFDGITVPRFIKYLELNSYHTEFFEPYFARDVVATAQSHNWHFTAESNLENDNATLTWDKDLLGRSDAQLILFDAAAGAIVDMKQSDHYSFKIQNKHPLHFFYGSDKENLKPDITTLASAYPNPVSNSVTFPVFIANSSENAQLEIYDNMGKVIKTIFNSSYLPGLHMEHWDCLDSQGTRVAPGMYVYRFVGESNLVQTGKLIVK